MDCIESSEAIWHETDPGATWCQCIHTIEHLYSISDMSSSGTWNDTAIILSDSTTQEANIATVYTSHTHSIMQIVLHRVCETATSYMHCV